MNKNTTVGPLASLLIVVAMIAALLVIMSALNEHFLGDLPPDDHHSRQEAGILREDMFSPFAESFASILTEPGASFLQSDMFNIASTASNSGHDGRNALPSISSILHSFSR
jgi:hypothetical protein